MNFTLWPLGRYIVSALICGCIAILFGSCGNTRQLTYMQGTFDTAKLSQAKFVDPLIQKGDLISIIVYSDNPEATKIYNQTLINAGPSSAGSSQQDEGSAKGADVSGSAPTTAGYLVDENGNIEFQGLGLLHVEGLTRTALKDTLNGRLTPFLVNPYYAIRFLNYRFTMLGEITKPGIYNIPGDRINLLEAIGLAGDMTYYGRRDNVLVMRETNGKRSFARLDLTKPDIIVSPYFYLQQNDVVIFEANKRKVAANDQVTMRNVSMAATVVSVVAILYSIFRK